MAKSHDGAAEVPSNDVVRHQSGRGLARRVARELPLIGVLYLVYQAGRLLASKHAGAAFEHAEQVWRFERWWRLPNEASLQHVMTRWPSLIEVADEYYSKVHFPVTVLVLVWLFLRRPAIYPWFRWTLALLTGAALIGHLGYPLAPPRMLTWHGLVDTATDHHQSVYGPVGSGVANQFAAMPSLHVGWAVLVALAVILAARSRWRWLMVLHPVLTFLVVVVTANHYWLDGLVACLLLAIALRITRPLLRRGLGTVRAGASHSSSDGAQSPGDDRQRRRHQGAAVALRWRRRARAARLAKNSAAAPAAPAIPAVTRGTDGRRRTYAPRTRSRTSGPVVLFFSGADPAGCAVPVVAALGAATGRGYPDGGSSGEATWPPSRGPGSC